MPLSDHALDAAILRALAERRGASLATLEPLVGAGRRRLKSALEALTARRLIVAERIPSAQGYLPHATCYRLATEGHDGSYPHH